MQVVYVETDMNTSSPAQVIYRKEKGYDKLWSSGLFRTRHFPQLEDHNDFVVLVVTTDRWRRDRLARIANDTKGAHRWRFAAMEDLKPEWMLHERILVNSKLEYKRLAKSPADYVSLGVVASVPDKKTSLIAAANRS